MDLYFDIWQWQSVMSHVSDIDKLMTELTMASRGLYTLRVGVAICVEL